MDMKAFWSGFAAAVSVVLLLLTVIAGDLGSRLAVAFFTLIATLTAVGFSHDARQTP